MRKEEKKMNLPKKFNKTAPLIIIGSILLSGCSYSSISKSQRALRYASVIGEVRKEKTVEKLNNKEKTKVEKASAKKEVPLRNNDPILINAAEPKNITYSLFLNDKEVKEYNAKDFPLFSDKYSDIEGVLTFRGNNLRNSPSFGIVNVKQNELKEGWSRDTSTSSWGGGAGWTGQPSIIKWQEDVKQIMNIKEEYRNKKDFVEVVYASLDGKVYFLDLETGKSTREAINIHNPIKGSVSLDPRGYPLLYVGQGIPESGKIGYRIFSLLDGKELYFINGIDPIAFRGWGAFDSAPVIDKEKDRMLLCGENGLFYNIKLNTKFDKKKKKITINPQVLKYRYKIQENSYQGIENSIAIHKNLGYFADNGGIIQCLNLQNMKPVWIFDNKDDTDATITIEVEGGTPYIYTANEVDKQGDKGKAYLRKIHGITGKLIFEKSYDAMSLLGEHPVNGGVLATSIIGKKGIKNLVIFNVARYKKFNSGLMVALDKRTGEEVWRLEMPNYCWSSPVDVYNEEGKGYILQGDSIGNLYLIEGKTGKILNNINLGTNIESSPAVFNSALVVATRGGKIFRVSIS
ncbi:PQQ-binding-like beta-propeller repeat protein [Clostridium bovifaecis]|uniref:PQQ-binding-like beta-propeller repeat protein n=1 Tax=Clostridium bovifaecis TaxID=2184719 RepID=A0A6I6F166_9CLOT|nr:PQQ-binding-like beta-propeller repeat protein [Clostridium bovifaecis]